MGNKPSRGGYNVPRHFLPLMPSNTHSQKVEVNYRGFYICRVWHPGYDTLHFKIRMLGGSYSCICLSSIKAAQNVIDTHINNIKKQIEPWS